MDADAGPRLVVLDGDVHLFEDARAATERQAREPVAVDPDPADGGSMPATDEASTIPVPGRPPARPLARFGRRDRLDRPHP